MAVAAPAPAGRRAPRRSRSGSLLTRARAGWRRSCCRRPCWCCSLVDRATRSSRASASRSSRPAGSTRTASSSRATQFVGLDNYTAIFNGRRAAPVLERVLQHHLLHRRLRGHRGRHRRRDGADHEPAFKGRGLIRASILVPWAIPTVVSALLWNWIFNANGVANAILGKQILWSTDGIQAQLAVIIADTWKTAPFIGLLVLAGLQVIPAEVYEAAKIDGADAPGTRSCTSRCRWSSRRCWWRCCSASSTTCACSTCPTC